MTLGLEPAALPADAVEVGRIADAWGIKGWFKVLPYSASAEALFSCKRWFLQPAEKGAKTFTGTLLLPIKEAKEHADVVVACAHEVATATPPSGSRVRAFLCHVPAFPPPKPTNTIGLT